MNGSCASNSDIDFDTVMPGLVQSCAGHPRLQCRGQDVDGRDKPGHDDEGNARSKGLRRGSGGCARMPAVNHCAKAKTLRTAQARRPTMVQESVVRHKRGGLYFEDFAVGRLYEHPLTRTVTQMDNMLFSNMTLNPQPLHIDRHFCEQETEWGQPLMNSLFTLGLMIGIMVNHLTVGTTIANLGMTEVKFPHPLFEGDTVHCTTEVISKRESTSRPGAGIVEFQHRAYNQNNKLVGECRRQVFMRMRPT
jgi:acyl dehydratase